MTKRVQRLIVIAWLALFVLLSTKEISLTRTDLGRHLTNGRILLEKHESSVLFQNLYSYTNPDFSFVNHHWGFGAVTHLIHSLSGFGGLSAFYLALLVTTLGILFWLSVRVSNILSASLVVFLALPLITCRPEIRPEGFSTLFSAVFMTLLALWQNSKTPRILPWVMLPFLSFLWVNIHIYFFLAPALVGAYLIQNLWIRGNRKKVWQHLGLGVVCCLATTLGPLGLKGALFPFQIFDNYSYAVAENYPLHQMIPSMAPLLPFLIALLALAVPAVKQQPALFLIGAGGALMAEFSIRNMALAGFLLLPIASSGAELLLRSLRKHRRWVLPVATLGLGYLAFFLIRIVPESSSKLGWGLIPGDSKAAEFFKTAGLKGPVFNNFDVGSYLIFHLFPQERTYIDARPEAYPSSFILNDYIQPQQDTNEWKRLDQKYHFNTILFSWPDRTQWGMEFLKTRSKDPEWVAIYLDPKIVILLRNSLENRPVIERYGRIQ